MSDHYLLSRFVDRGDEAAFTALVRRHGKMVHAVGRRVLRDSDGADDIFQTTFLVLAQKASQLAARTDRGASLSAWLYRVACNKALALRRANVSRQRREAGFAHTRRAAHRDGGIFDCILPFLDEEIDALPARYRMPVILCHLQGKTQLETAESLGITFATVRRRLDRACQLLRNRLTKRGFACSLALLAPLFGRAAEAAGLPRTGLLKSTTEAAVSARQVTEVTAVAASQSSGLFASMREWGGSWSPVNISCAVAAAIAAIGVLFAIPLFGEPHSADADRTDLTQPVAVQTSVESPSPPSPHATRRTNSRIENWSTRHDDRDRAQIFDDEPAEFLAEESQTHNRLPNWESPFDRRTDEPHADDAANLHGRDGLNQQQVAQNDSSSVQRFQPDLDENRNDRQNDALAGARQILEQVRDELKTIPQLGHGGGAHAFQGKVDFNAAAEQFGQVAGIQQAMERFRQRSKNRLQRDNPRGATNNATGSELLRTWTDRRSNRRFRARYVGYEKGTVRLRTSDGEEVSLPLTTLSTADRRVVLFEQRRQRAEHRQTKQQPLVEKAKDLPELIRQNNLDWHTTTKRAYRVAEADEKPVMWFRVLGDLEGFM